MIRVKSPTRVDLAGGTLDCWPLHLFVGDCVTVNIAIDIFTGCDLEPRTDKVLSLEIVDLKYKNEFPSLQAMLASSDRELLLVQKVLEYFQPDYGFNLKTYSQSPVGGGLGGSSSLCISLIRAFCQRSETQLSADEAVHLAHNLEAKVIASPTGTQDYYPALLSGLNILHYRADGVRVENVPFSQDVFNQNMMLIYTGKAHHSGINNWQVIKAVIEGDQATLENLKEIARIAEDTAIACRQAEWHKLPPLFQREFNARIKLAPAFTSPEIEDLTRIIFETGGAAVKICGAGGGGCVMVWAESQLHERISLACQKRGFQTLKASPVNWAANSRDRVCEKAELVTAN